LSKKQSIVTLSTCEAEYVVASLGVSHAIWLRRLLQELKCPQLELTEIRVDNKSAIELAKNPVQNNDQTADIFAKILLKSLFEN
jgi:hypothetical protein